MFKHIVRIRWPIYKCHSFKCSPSVLSAIPISYLNVDVARSTTTLVQNRLHDSNENNFAYNIISKQLSPITYIRPTEAETLEEFESTLDKCWRDATATEIVEAIKSVKKYCIKNNITIEDTRFDKLVDGLMDHCEELTYVELVELLECLSELPLAHGYDTHNFHDVWSCLDDISCWQMLEWNVDQSFTVANLWFKLRLGRLCDYIFLLLDRLAKKADKKRSVDFEYEYALSKKVNTMNIDELAVVAMGYFKTRTSIKILSIVDTMIKSVCENAKQAHDISLSAILKILRLSKPVKLTSDVFYMLDKLLPEIPRLSDLCCLHIALLSTGIQNYHPETLQIVSEKMVKNIHNKEKIRLKDIERILHVLTMFDYDPKTLPDIFHSCYNELHSTERADEFISYNRSLVSALHYLSLKNMYSYQLLDKILREEYITEVYGKAAKNVPRELFSLECSIDIECPDYKGSRLSKKLRHKVAKWTSDFTPSKDQVKKISSAEELILDAIDVTTNVVGGKDFIFVDHVLPHFSRADIVVCKDRETGKFIKPPGFEEYILGDVMFPVKDEKLTFYSIVILGWHNTIRDQNTPLGLMLMKKRQLEKIGYKPVFVIWKEFLSLSEDGRNGYISSKLM
ncbi:unnamed protein product [Acanthoscelides obtectus]|uniref:RAP domain-containing protein n=1 Tax=Acanthoscelides obtectus TaxID=200917 RepID=A0A9P0JI34_ACAOB|nr:unnamed protein product [Acanthoscelides obtectus]CAK1661415.1 FAST kinase domain-containing protein 5, mitochondrial [Acanthoscelides obtectus]